LTITLGYAAFALTLGLADMTLFHFMRKAKSQTISSLNQLTYRAMQFGVVLIAAGTILGGIWADYSWGRFWGWDPKEVWALITLLCYLTILHGRFTNWMSQFGFAAFSAVSFLSVVMAWYGVNFILGVGLHSYGFSTGGTPWVIGFVVIQLAYVGLAALINWQRKRPVLKPQT
jgi:ABC-type transport system involved in cytochrome c biogenesis permease subunit